MTKAQAVEATIIEPEASELVFTKVQPGLAIEGNFEAVRAHIERIVADYEGLVVTEDYVAQAKKDRAYLNSLATSLTQRFREVKKTYMAPVDALDRQIKELEGPIKAASLAIDEQVKAFEAREKADKRAKLVEHWNDYAGVLVEAVPFERIERAEWLNRSYAVGKAFGDIESIVERIAREEATLDELNLSHPRDAKSTYMATLDMSAAIARSKELDEQEERTRRFEAEKAEIAAQREADAAKAQEPEPEAPDVFEAMGLPTVDVPTVPVSRERTFTVTATDAQVDGIIAYLKGAGIQGTVTR